MLLQAIDLHTHFVQRAGWMRRLVGRGAAEETVIRAVDGVSFAVQQGEIFGILGESGSGKTTLVRTLLGLTPMTRGEVWFQGKPLHTLPPAERKAMLRRQARLIFQHPDAALNPAFSIAQVLDQALRLHTDLASEARKARMRELLHAVGLPATYLKKHPHELSGGEKRRVGIARALATEPALLVADEPTSGLDVSLQGQILALLRQLRDEQGVTLLLISHDLGLVRSLCDRIAVMQNGRFVEIGTRDELSPERCQHPYTRALLDAHLTL